MTGLTWKPLQAITTKGSTVVLRRLCEHDLDQCGRWINDPELRQLLSVDYPVSLAEEEQWLKRVTERAAGNPTDITLGIVVDGHLVGSTGLHRISLRHRTAVVGILIGELEYRAAGVGSTVYQLLAHFAFEELDLRCLRAAVIESNEASCNLHLKTGYREVGRIPQWFYKDGRYQDELIYCLMREDWQNRKPN